MLAGAPTHRFLLLKFGCVAGFAFFSDPCLRANTVAGRIAIVSQREIKRAGAFMCSRFAIMHRQSRDFDTAAAQHRQPNNSQNAKVRFIGARCPFILGTNPSGAAGTELQHGAPVDR